MNGLARVSWVGLVPYAYIYIYIYTEQHTIATAIGSTVHDLDGIDDLDRDQFGVWKVYSTQHT